MQGTVRTNVNKHTTVARNQNEMIKLRNNLCIHKLRLIAVRVIAMPGANCHRLQLFERECSVSDKSYLDINKMNSIYVTDALI